LLLGAVPLYCRQDMVRLHTRELARNSSLCNVLPARFFVRPLHALHIARPSELKDHATTPLSAGELAVSKPEKLGSPLLAPRFEDLLQDFLGELSTLSGSGDAPDRCYRRSAVVAVVVVVAVVAVAVVAAALVVLAVAAVVVGVAGVVGGVVGTGEGRKPLRGCCLGLGDEDCAVDGSR